MKPVILLVHTPDIGEDILAFLETELTSIFGLPVSCTGGFDLMPAELNTRRGQYDAAKIIHRLPDPPHGTYLLGVTDADLYTEGLNFVFGIASPSSRKALVSVYRLGLSGPSRPLFLRRILTEAVHEIGHLFGLPHCLDPRCVMRFSNTLEDTDVKGYQFCSKCKARILH